MRMKFSLPIAALLLCTALACAETPAELALKPYTLPTAPDARAWPRARLVGFMTELADFVEKNQRQNIQHPTRQSRNQPQLMVES